MKNSLVYSEIMYLLYICIYLVFESQFTNTSKHPTPPPPPKKQRQKAKQNKTHRDITNYFLPQYFANSSPQALYLTPRVYWLDNRVMEQCHTTYIKSGTECRLFKGYIKELTVSFNNYLTIMY